MMNLVYSHRFFKSVYKANNASVDDYDVEMNWIPNSDVYERINEDVVEKALRELNISKGKGSDVIPPLVYRNCSIALTGSIKLLVERSNE